MNFLLHMLAEGWHRLASDGTGLVDVAIRTLLLAAGSTVFACAIGIPLGAAAGLGHGRVARLFRAAVNTGLGLPAVVLGVYLALLMLPGHLLGPLGLTNTIEGVMLAQVLLALPIAAALTASAVMALPAGLPDQARGLGASSAEVLMLVVREARIAVAVAAFAAFGSALSEVGAVVIVGGNIRGSTNTLASTVLLDLSAGDPAGATACVMVLMAFVVLTGIALTLVQRSRGSARARG